MITFLLILVLVFVAVDLLVRFVIDPLIIASNKKNKVAKSFAPRFDPSVKLAIETMYDGGKPHKEEEPGGTSSDENKSNDSSKG
jgi:hypothetical protein